MSDDKRRNEPDTRTPDDTNASKIKRLDDITAELEARDAKTNQRIDELRANAPDQAGVVPQDKQIYSADAERYERIIKAGGIGRRSFRNLSDMQNVEQPTPRTATTQTEEQEQETEQSQD